MSQMPVFKAAKCRFIFSLLGRGKEMECSECKSRENLTIDHVIPQRENGNNGWGNLRLLCIPCHEKRNMREGLTIGELQPIDKEYYMRRFNGKN